MGGGTGYQEKIGCIDIGDNVFIGSNTTILYDVRIGTNVIIGAGSLVNKDIPDNSVAAGVPARVIGTFEDFIQKRAREEKYPEGLKPQIGRSVPPALEKVCWDRFDKSRGVRKER